MTLVSETEFSELVEAVQMSIYQNLENAWKEDRLDEYLHQIGLNNLAPNKKAPAWDEAMQNGKIIIFGEAAIKDREILASVASQGISKDRVELHIEYSELKHFDFGKLRYNSDYRLILVGPMPHSTKDKGEHSSVISMMEQEEGFTKIVRLTSNGQLKMTKSNIKEAIREAVASGYLAAG